MNLYLSLTLLSLHESEIGIGEGEMNDDDDELVTFSDAYSPVKFKNSRCTEVL